MRLLSLLKPRLGLQSGRLRVDAARLRVEYPLLLLYVLAHHATGKGLVEALQSLESGSPLSLMLSESRKAAKLVLQRIRRGETLVEALEAASRQLPEPLSSFLHGYATALYVSGDVVGYVRRCLSEAYSSLRSVVEAAAERASLIAEVVALLAGVLAIGVALVASSFEVMAAALSLIGLAVLLLSIHSKLHLVDVLVGIDRRARLLGVAGLVAAVASTLASSTLGAALAVASVAMLATAYLLQSRRRRALREIAEALSLLAEEQKTRERPDSEYVIERLRGLEYARPILYAIATGRLRASGSEPPVSVLAASVAATLIRTGARAVEALEEFASIARRLWSTLSSTEGRALLAEGVIAAGAVASVVVGQALNTLVVQTAGLVPQAPAAASVQVPFAQLLSATVNLPAVAAASALLAVAASAGLSYALRGSPSLAVGGGAAALAVKLALLASLL